MMDAGYTGMGAGAVAAAAGLIFVCRLSIETLRDMLATIGTMHVLTGHHNQVCRDHHLFPEGNPLTADERPQPEQLNRKRAIYWIGFGATLAVGFAACAYYPTTETVTSVGLSMDILGVIAVSSSNGAWNANEHPGAEIGLWFLGSGFAIQIAAQWI